MKNNQKHAGFSSGPTNLRRSCSPYLFILVVGRRGSEINSITDSGLLIIPIEPSDGICVKARGILPDKRPPKYPRDHKA
jgi:hypothetical protein